MALDMYIGKATAPPPEPQHRDRTEWCSIRAIILEYSIVLYGIQ